MHMHTPEFSAAVQRWHGFARIEQGVFVEGCFHRMKQRQFGGAELHAHGIYFFHADAVFAGNGAAKFNRQLEDFRAKGLGALEFPRAVGVIQDQRMQITVAGMKHVHAAQTIFGGQCGDRIEHGGERLFRNGAVHAIVVRRDAAGSGKCRLASGPEAQAFGLVLRDAHCSRAAVLHDFRHARDFLGDFGGGAVGLAEQDGGCIQRVAGFNKRFDCTGGDLVHHLKTRWNDAGGNHVGNCCTGLGDVVKRRQHALCVLRHRQQFDRHLGDDGEQAFRACQ